MGNTPPIHTANNEVSTKGGKSKTASGSVKEQAAKALATVASKKVYQ